MLTWLLGVNEAVSVAMIMAGSAMGAATISAWATRTVHRISERAKANEAELEERRFSMEYFERMTEAAVAEAERWKAEYKEEQAIAMGFASKAERMEERVRLLSDRLVRAEAWIRQVHRLHPDIEETVPYDQ